MAILKRRDFMWLTFLLKESSFMLSQNIAIWLSSPYAKETITELKLFRRWRQSCRRWLFILLSIPCIQIACLAAQTSTTFLVVISVGLACRKLVWQALNCHQSSIPGFLSDDTSMSRFMLPLNYWTELWISTLSMRTSFLVDPNQAEYWSWF